MKESETPEQSVKVLNKPVNISGAFSSTSTDVGIAGTPEDGFGRFYDVKVDGFAKYVYLDGYFNSVWTGCFFEREQGDASAFSEPGVVDVNLASNPNNTRVIGCFFGQNTIEHALVIEANKVQVIGYQAEANEDGEIKAVFGGGNQILGARVQNATGTPSIDVNDGSTTLTALEMEASGSSQTAVDLSGAGAGAAKVAGPFHFSGCGSNCAGVGTTTSVDQKAS